GWFSFLFSIGKPPRPRDQWMLRDIFLLARPPLLAVMQGGVYRSPETHSRIVRAPTGTDSEFCNTLQGEGAILENTAATRMIWIYILAAIAILQGIVTLLDGVRAARYMCTFRPRRRSNERVVVFCPCKGTDSEFQKNIQSILTQDYPNYEAQFIVESK